MGLLDNTMIKRKIKIAISHRYAQGYDLNLNLADREQWIRTCLEDSYQFSPAEQAELIN